MRDKTPFNENGQPHGHWIVFRSAISNTIWYEAYYINGEQYGYEISTRRFENHEEIYKEYHAR